VRLKGKEKGKLIEDLKKKKELFLDQVFGKRGERVRKMEQNT